MNVFGPYHPCQRTLSLFAASPFVARAAMDDARVRLVATERPILPSSLLNTVCDVWARYRGAGRDSDQRKSADTRSSACVDLWDKIYWLVESSILMDIHLNFDPTRSTAKVRKRFAFSSEYSLACKSRSDVLRLVVMSIDSIYTRR